MRRVGVAVLSLVCACGGTSAVRVAGSDGGVVDARLTDRLSDPATVETGSFAETGCSSGQPNIICLAAAGPDYLNRAIAVDDENVYWAAAGQTAAQDVVMRVPRAGGVAATLAQGSPSIMLVADGVNVYWGEAAQPNYGPGVLKRVPVTGGKVVTVAATNSLACLAHDQDNIYWTDLGETGAEVVKLAKAGGAVATLTIDSGSTAGALAVDEARIYAVLSDNSVISIGKDGGGASTVLPASSNFYFNGCRDIAVADGTLFVLGALNGLVTIPVTGGVAPTVLHVGTYSTVEEVADATRLFWVGSTPALEIHAIPVDGGPAETLATPLAVYVWDIALGSDGTVYWTTDRQVESLAP